MFFAHQTPNSPVSDLALFDAVVIHYSIRLPFNEVAGETAQALEAFGGLKVLFIQDEYDQHASRLALDQAARHQGGVLVGAPKR